MFFPTTESKEEEKITIAYAVSLTSCNDTTANLDGAAVLKHSIERFDSFSKYKSKFYAFVHPNATSCAGIMQQMGYEVQERPTPINVTDIRGPLKKFVEGAGCCGAAEFLKLYAYTLTQYPIAVHLDLDVLVLNPLDDLFDAMMEGASSPARSRLPAMWINHTSQLPAQIDAYFTRDYNMLKSAGHRTPTETSMQGGFLVLRPNITLFQEFIDIILEGKYEAGRGWGAPELRYGGTYGSAQIQGIIAYFYGHVHPRTAVELNRCVVNNMVDRPFDKEGTCRTPRQDDGSCEDCRETHVSDILSTHFTICGKPWKCHNHEETLCKATHKEWFKVRWELERKWQKVSFSYNSSAIQSTSQDNDMPWIVNGNWSFCSGRGGYLPMALPS